MGQGERTPLIDVHAHFVPDVYRRALADGGFATLDGGMAIPDWSAERALETMDRHGIDKAILSVSSPGLMPAPASQEAALARAINGAGAQLIGDHPARFGGFAMLPLGSLDSALAEVDHALDTLRLDGFIVQTHHHGRRLSDPELTPLLARLDARGALVFIHPTSPHCPQCAGMDRPGPLIEFPFETTRAVVDLLYSGTLARYPSIRFILAHGGGTLPFLAQRIAGFSGLPVAGAAPGVDAASIIAQLGRLYYDTALATSPAQIFALRQLVSIDNILFGSDWPFSPEVVLGGSLAALRGSTLIDDGERAAILGGNAQRLLGQAAV